MVSPINTPSTGEISHLSIDDLLAPLPEKTCLGGPGPFVINLCTSNAPIALPVKGMTDIKNAYVYQVQRTEDRRPRYRLRFGPFANEDEADAVLQKARDTYPSALTATADSDDLRAIATMQAKAGTLRPPAQQAASSSSVAAKQNDSGPPAAVSTPVLTSKHKIPEQMIPVVTAAVLHRPVAHAPRQVEPAAVRSPALESNKTVCALTQLDVEDARASRWFVIQLSLSEHAYDPDSVPNLDIFSVYRLYSVAGIHQGRIAHALRLGFFSEEIAARAVASYLAAFYDQPVIKRVSSAERQRFAEQPLEPRKDVGATGKQAVIEITDERFVRAPRSVKPAGK